MKKLVVFLSIFAMISLQGSNVFAYDHINEDEPNDMPQEAQVIWLDGHRQLGVLGEVSRSDKEDWFKIIPNRAGTSDFELEAFSSDSDFDLYLYDEERSLIESSTEFEGVIEDIDGIEIYDDRIYYLKVRYFGGRSGDYDLKVDID